MTPFLESFYDPCPCGFPCELYRRYAAMELADWRRRKPDDCLRLRRYQSAP